MNKTANATLRMTLGAMVANIEPKVPGANNDSEVMEQNRKMLSKQIKWLSEHPEYIEKTLLKVMTVLERTKQDSVILQATLNKHLIKDNKEKSLAISAQVIYLLREIGLLKMEMVHGNDGTKYYKVSLGPKLDLKTLQLRKVKRKLARKASRKALLEPTTKTHRNNSKGLYQFSWDETKTTQSAMQKLQQNKLRLSIPDSVFKEDIVRYVFKKSFDHDYEKGMAAEILSDLQDINGKTFYVDKSADRSLRIYGRRNIDISAPSMFRLFLRLPVKRKLTEQGYCDTVEYYKEEVLPALQSKIEGANSAEELEFWNNLHNELYLEVNTLEPGAYTNLMVEVDANNQGPANICLLMKDRANFMKYWGRKDAPKLYRAFRVELLKRLELPEDTLADIDVKYKLMTKPYNKQDVSNVLGGSDFWEKIENAFIPALELAKYDFYELPLKLQLEKKLGNDYNFTDKQLMDAYVGAMDAVAPFLNQFKNVIDGLQKFATIKPSIWKWRALNDDFAMAARTMTVEDKVSFFDITGKKHTITYQTTELVPSNKFGGETVLSPTLLASVDASMNTYIINNADHWIASNHDAWFVHGNDKQNIVKLYKEIAEEVIDYGDYWLQSMILTYDVRGFGENPTFDKLFLVKDVLTKEDVRNAENLVG